MDGRPIKGIVLENTERGAKNALGIDARFLHKRSTHRRGLAGKIVDYLRAHRGPASRSFIIEFLNRKEVSGNNREVYNIDSELEKALQDNVKIQTVRDTYAYKPTYSSVHNQKDLLKLLADHPRYPPQGIPMEDLSDAYVGLLHDLQELDSQRKVLRVMNIDSKAMIVYPVLETTQQQVDDDIKGVWNSVVMPSSQADLEAKLHNSGHLSKDELHGGFVEGARRQKVARKIERKRAGGGKKRRINKLTNSHLLKGENKQNYEWLKQA